MKEKEDKREPLGLKVMGKIKISIVFKRQWIHLVLVKEYWRKWPSLSRL
jgi:hypothetical protein